MTYKLSEEQIAGVVKKGAAALFRYCQSSDIHYLVIGSSGGLDSAVMLGFSQRACQIATDADFPLTSVGLIMPCQSSPEDERLGREAIRVFGAKGIYISLDALYRSLQENTFDKEWLDGQILIIRQADGDSLSHWAWLKKIAQGNIKARLRMIMAYHVARMLEGIVLSTDNLSEFWMAFWTLHGDVGDFGLIQNILKGLELYDIAQYLGVPQEIIDRKPSDGLGISGTDEDQLGANYSILDRAMIGLIQQDFGPDGSLDQLQNLPVIQGVSKSVVEKLAERCLRGSFKRQGPVVLSRKDLGLIPIEEIELGD